MLAATLRTGKYIWLVFNLFYGISTLLYTLIADCGRITVHNGWQASSSKRTTV
jgi:hypothetical protein